MRKKVNFCGQIWWTNFKSSVATFESSGKKEFSGTIEQMQVSNFNSELQISGVGADLGWEF